MSELFYIHRRSSVVTLMLWQLSVGKSPHANSGTLTCVSSYFRILVLSQIKQMHDLHIILFYAHTNTCCLWILQILPLNTIPILERIEPFSNSKCWVLKVCLVLSYPQDAVDCIYTETSRTLGEVLVKFLFIMK